ncbi:hypothetical protein Rleg_6951 (plasmid) [Rhizobium leguminosarum bv. trifolii WSM1325]|uniref:Uncharacterized protein n=1 Tax=Rhizobium leguminosarum bv. trifolii (strain WSM1325) TaxID=395491 RepID=C6B7C4_RHILS|nr:hypothetical protein [Rhizobium leguminosarum]ACS59982.1 hypothetical protein Rleg_6951 [Rhizobium leguminosarum bv. trifolii WSM1325]
MGAGHVAVSQRLRGASALLRQRVSFFFGGALFSAIFFRHLPELDALPPFAQACVKSVYVAATLFGLFCYSLELARFGQAVEDGPPERGR